MGIAEPGPMLPPSPAAEGLLWASFSLHPALRFGGRHRKGVGRSGLCLPAQRHLHQQELSSLGGVWEESLKAQTILVLTVGETCQHMGIDIKTNIQQHRSLLPNQKFKVGCPALLR